MNVTNRRDRIIEALAGVDLADTFFTWSAPDQNSLSYCIWMRSMTGRLTDQEVWLADTRDEVLEVHAEMQALADAARRLVA